MVRATSITKCQTDRSGNHVEGPMLHAEWLQVPRFLLTWTLGEQTGDDGPVSGRKVGDDLAAGGGGKADKQIDQNGQFRIAGASSGASDVWCGCKWRVFNGYDGRPAARHAGGHWFKSSTAQSKSPCKHTGFLMRGINSPNARGLNRRRTRFFSDLPWPVPATHRVAIGN